MDQDEKNRAISQEEYDYGHLYIISLELPEDETFAMADAPNGRFDKWGLTEQERAIAKALFFDSSGRPREHPDKRRVLTEVLADPGKYPFLQKIRTEGHEPAAIAILIRSCVSA